MLEVLTWLCVVAIGTVHVLWISLKAVISEWIRAMCPGLLRIGRSRQYLVFGPCSILNEIIEDK